MCIRDRLVTLAQATQDFDGVVDGWLAHIHRLETALQGGVPFDVLAVLVEGGGDAAGDECGDEALACVGCACVCVATTIPAREDGDAHRHHCHFPPRFSAAAKRLALRLVQAALCATSSAYLRHGCYGDPGWEFHAMVSDTSLSLARTALRSAGAR